MAGQYVFVIAFLVFSLFVLTFYHALGEGCRNIIAGNLINPDGEEVVCTDELKTKLEKLASLAVTMEITAFVVACVNVLVILLLSSHGLTNTWKVIASLANARIIIGIFQLITDFGLFRSLLTEIINN